MSNAILNPCAATLLPNRRYVPERDFGTIVNLRPGFFVTDLLESFKYMRDLFQGISTYPQNNLNDLLPDKWKQLGQSLHSNSDPAWPCDHTPQEKGPGMCSQDKSWQAAVG